MIHVHAMVTAKLRNCMVTELAELEYLFNICHFLGVGSGIYKIVRDSVIRPSHYRPLKC